MPAKRSRALQSRPGKKRYLPFATIALLVIAISMVTNFLNGLFFSTKELSALPVPKVHSVFLPGILTFPFPNGPVLGVQNFDPIEVVDLVNKEREQVGSPQLRLNPLLMKAAKMRADVILKYENFSHHDPYEGIALTTVLPKVGYNYAYASENIGMDGGGADTFVTGFMHSTAHRENLLDPKLTETGVAMVIGNYKQYYVNIVVQLFAIPAGKDEYLGYTSKDVETYKDTLAKLDQELNPFVWAVGEAFGNPEFAQPRYQKLLRQREILVTVYNQMRQEKPLDNSHVAMIIEYNNSLN